MNFENGVISALKVNLFFGMSVGWLIYRAVGHCLRVMIDHRGVEHFVMLFFAVSTIYKAQTYPLIHISLDEYLASNDYEISFESGFKYMFKQTGVCLSGYIFGTSIAVIVDMCNRDVLHENRPPLGFR